ncbi:MAG: hypothetical protein V3V18_13330 [Methylococcales bacterium]
MPDYQDRTLALLGIAATTEVLHQPCPSENIMSAFIEDRIDLKTRAMMLSHLNRCEICYLTWEQLNISVVQDNLQTIKKNKADKVWFHRRSKRRGNSSSSLQKKSPWLVLVSLLITFAVYMFVTSFLTITSDPSMDTATTFDVDVLASNIDQLPVPWKNQLSGPDSSAYSLPAKAFGTGIWSAKNELLGANQLLPAQLVSLSTIDWQGSQWSIYHAFGRLTLDVWVLANANKQVKLAQWTLLRKSLQALEIGFQKRQQFEPEASIALQMIDKMKVSLTRLSRKSNHSARKTLLNDIEIGLRKLCF